MPVAVVTGGSRGIGRACVLALARRGFDVAVNYRQGADRAAAVAEEARALGRRALPVQADVARADDVEAMFDLAEKELGPVEALVNNAGENRVQPILEISDADLQRMLDVNLKGAFFALQSAGRRMLPRGRGAIVNVASMASVLARPGSAAYGMAKAGVVSLTMSAAEAFAPHVAVNAVAPGFVDTELNAYIPAERRRSITEQTPMKRFATVDEVADLVAYLATGPRFLTGQVVRIDGGIGNVYFRS